MKLKHIIFIDNLKRKCKTEFLDTVFKSPKYAFSFERDRRKRLSSLNSVNTKISVANFFNTIVHLSL